ncbi:hypothetical protein EJ03DRAFT_348951 [Teratosphaeria nubilosa]|uniref:Uncharacterized protein n=1 Tax=Teratosphaeria nubilosa TaxID=161662 RepID=A0A6G1LHU3_9PEZI|nr:hypothetical protein EJ03DRAFT_348951 [Teratosphaeria nubilosa]
MAKHTPPPPYRTHASAPIDLLNGVQATVRRDRVRDGANISVIQTEADRLHNFILFVLAVDYQRHITGYTAPLSAEDNQHFGTLSYQLQNLAQSNRHTPLNRSGRYQGVAFGLVRSQRDGVERLAEKLLMDENVVIPRLLPNRKVRWDLIDGLREVKEMYFERILGVEGSVAVGSRVIYTLNRQGMACEEHHARVSSVIDGFGAVSPARWAKRAKENMSRILARRGQSPKEAASEKPAR